MFIQRFGSLLNAHTHLHLFVLDGLCEGNPEGGVRFVPADPIDQDAVLGVLAPALAPLQPSCRFIRQDLTAQSAEPEHVHRQYVHCPPDSPRINTRRRRHEALKVLAFKRLVVVSTDVDVDQLMDLRD